MIKIEIVGIILTSCNSGRGGTDCRQFWFGSVSPRFSLRVLPLIQIISGKDFLTNYQIVAFLRVGQFWKSLVGVHSADFCCPLFFLDIWHLVTILFYLWLILPPVASYLAPNKTTLSFHLAFGSFITWVVSPKCDTNISFHLHCARPLFREDYICFYVSVYVCSTNHYLH